MNHTKHLYYILGLMLFSLTVAAQEQKQQKFSPEKFDQELRQFIIQKAALTPDESEHFFPLYQEMRKQQHALYVRQRSIGKVKPADDAGCMKAVQERDKVELEQKRLQQSYHNKFFDVLSASKVYDVLRAEEEFHRSKLKQWGRKK